MTDGFQALDEERAAREAEEARRAAEEADPDYQELLRQSHDEIDRLREADEEEALPPHPDEQACDMALDDYMRWLAEERDTKEAARVEGHYSLNRWPPDFDDREPEIFDDPEPDRHYPRD